MASLRAQRREVLNDFVDEDARRSVPRWTVQIPQFVDGPNAAISGGGLPATGRRPDSHVRDWEATRDRKQGEPVFRKSVETDRGRLTFTSITELDSERHELVLSETHTLVNEAGEHSSDYRFVMQCWTRSELESGSVRSGFRSVAYFGAYDPVVPAGATDRLVAVAQLSEDVAIGTS